MTVNSAFLAIGLVSQAVAGTGLAPGTGEQAQPPSQITVSYSGALYFLPVADIGLNVVYPDDTYSASATFQSAGLLRWFDDTNIEAGVSGYRTGRELQPWRYEHLNHASGTGRTVGIDFINGIAEPDINPPFGSMGEPPASETERTGAMDPISVIMGMMLGMPFDGTSDSVCEGRLPVFDGKARYDLRFENDGIESVRSRAWRGDAVVCRAYIEPINGYDPGDRPSEEETRRPVTMWLAPIEGVHVPVRFRAKTDIGNINIHAQSLSVE